MPDGTTEAWQRFLKSPVQIKFLVLNLIPHTHSYPLSKEVTRRANCNVNAMSAKVTEWMVEYFNNCN
jgi:hypothetical protein